MLQTLLKGLSAMKSFLISAALGLLALALVNLTGQYTGVWIPVNRLSLAASGVLGVPGVTLLVILNTLLL
ncbi:pro-sigmaK processing inhibitor BofA family protein [Acutalibacter sp. 1XD8-33]|uniref:pro-sigmaK processing inhibitor BofA family protein n=1 Tax=Acutalibacter sp. 1XD8-33 TaxID=2320081 RepID=UPI00242FA738|nr:pro-sigmaK processing inhibitor BofA family protein [Acutalibacter sp. 1XD8-33]